MENRKALDFFRKMAATNNEENSVKLANNSDFTTLDAEFILKYVNSSTHILDLGAGTGLVVNKIYDKVEHIVAVEPFANFAKHIVQSNNITIVNETILNFLPSKQFDIITIFAVMHYFNEKEAIEIYERYYPCLKYGGKLIIKNQFGVSHDVLVDGYSEEQKSDYFAQYRHLQKEIEILDKIGYKNIEPFDIYPPECSRWNNTHFYAIVAEK